MKHFFKKILTVVMATAMIAVSIAAIPGVCARAAGSVTLYFQNAKGWSSVYCYTFYGSDATGAAWPGIQMTSVGNNWYKYTYTGTNPINVIFDDGSNKNQTTNNDPKDLDVSKSTYWFTIADGTGGTGYGSGYKVTVNTTAQAGWPTDGAAATTATPASNLASSTPASNPASSAPASTGSSVSSSTVTSASTSNSPKTGDNSNYLIYSLISLAIVSAATIGVIGVKKADTKAK